jgi:peptidoglycan/LPS O-acetylase OafA/YrhL
LREIRALTSLRGLFALLVFSFHATIYTPAGRPVIAGIGRGYLAVDFFFVLSGFILGVAYAERTQSLAAYRRFVWIRFGRLFPLQVFVTLLIAIFAGIPYLPGFIQEITLTNSLYQNGVHPQMNAVDWSLSTEWVANLFFPVLVVLTRPRYRLAIVAICIAALFAITTSPMCGLDTLQSSSALTDSMVRCFAEFTLGLASSRMWQFDFLSKDIVLFPLLAVIVGLFFVPRTDYVIALLLPPFVLGTSANTGRLSRILTIKPLLVIGDISFSIYLLHTPVFRVVAYYLHGMPMPDYALSLLFAFIGLVLTLAASLLTYHFIEMPARNWFKRVAAGRRTVVIAPATSS